MPREGCNGKDKTRQDMMIMTTNDDGDDDNNGYDNIMMMMIGIAFKIMIII